MKRLSLSSQRRWFGLTALGITALGVYVSFFWNGIPVIWGPSASDKEIAAGQELFEHEWMPNDPLAHGDGVGPVFNAKSCAACHFQGGLGGSGTNLHNAVSFEIMPRPDDPTFLTGTVHNFSVDPAQRESESKLAKLYPEIPGRTIRSGDPHCASVVNIPNFNPVRTEQVQSTALFGAGWIDLISERAIQRNRRKRLAESTVKEMKLEFEQIPVGRLRTLEDGRVGRFGWKAQFASLSDFVAAACANELGLGTPDVPQAKPLGYAMADVAPDLDRKQVRALVSFVKTLSRPVEATPETTSEQVLAIRGKEVFASMGCATCHVPDMGGVEGVYSDFLLYSIDDPNPPPGSPGSGGYGPEPPPQLNLPLRPESDPKPSEWRTPPLWGVADSAPYLHDGSAPTLKDAVLRHHGDARIAMERFKVAGGEDQAALIAFLKTLKAPPTALPLKDPNATRLARK